MLLVQKAYPPYFWGKYIDQCKHETCYFLREIFVLQPQLYDLTTMSWKHIDRSIHHYMDRNLTDFFDESRGQFVDWICQFSLMPLCTEFYCLALPNYSITTCHSL